MTDQQFTAKPVSEIPPVRREQTGTKYDYLFEDARKQGKVEVECPTRNKAASLSTYLRRVSSDEEFYVTQRLESVFIEHLA